MPKKDRSKATFQTLSTKVQSSEVRHETFMGNDYIVVPIIALVEGVIQGANAATPELALAEEFGKFSEGWNGRPVTLNHPKRNGHFVSASASPQVYEEEALGFLFNTKLEDNKLKTEAWIDLARVNNASEEVQKEIARLENNEVTEVSTGLYASVEDTRGKFNNEDFQGIWREIVPDHLAILSEGTIGACSVKDGCGSNRNNSGLEINCGCQKDNAAQPTTEDILKGLKGIFSSKQRNNLSFDDTETAITQALALETENEGEYTYYYVVSVDSNMFVYMQNWDGVLWQRSYSVSDTGTITLGTDSVRVRPVTEYVPVTIKENMMNKEELINSLIANKATSFAEADRDWLKTFSEEQLKKLEPSAQTEAPKAPEGKVQEVAKPATAAEYVAEAPAEIREVLNQGIKMHAERRSALVESLKSNKRNKFTDEDFKAMNLETLERMVELANVPSFEGRGGGQIQTNSEPSNAVGTMPKVFEAKK